MVCLRNRRVVVPTIAAIALATTIWSAAKANADAIGDTRHDGARITATLTKTELANLAMGYTLAGEPDPIKYQYASAIACGNAGPESDYRDFSCMAAFIACEGNTPEEGLGPLVRLYRRQVDPPPVPSPGEWTEVGSTCFPELVPGRATLGIAQILKAFHDTKFALPRLVIQPKGNVTLVNLATYYQLIWPSAGYQPGEIDAVDPARMLGFRVDIKPSLKSVVYHFGDGTAYGPTTSLGGPYPSGDVVKTYSRPGTYRVYAEAVYSGQFRIGRGAWINIPGTVPITGTSVDLVVKTATARLYQN